jgi:hypothetical protein
LLNLMTRKSKVQVTQRILVFACLLLLQRNLTAQNSSIHLDGYIPKSLSELSNRATLIVEAEVQSVYTPTALNNDPRTLHTDALLRITRVLKGSGRSSQLVVGQAGGVLPGRSVLSTQFNLMKPGERYILFLKDLSQRGAEVLPDRGFPRFETIGYAGLFFIDESGSVRLNPELPFRNTYDQRNKDVVISEIQMSLNGAAQP